MKDRLDKISDHLACLGKKENSFLRGNCLDCAGRKVDKVDSVSARLSRKDEMVGCG